MKRIFRSFLLAIILISGSSFTVFSQTNQRIKVMCFNIRMSGQLTSYQAQPFADLILQHQPDIIAFQEVDYKGARSGNKDILTEIGKLTGMFPLFGKAIPLSGSGLYGVAILSKYPISTSKLVPLAYPDGAKERRVALLSEVTFPNSYVLKFVSTHLDNSTDEVRLAMTQNLNGNEILYGTLPVILAGDFNAQPSASTIAAGMNQWQRLCDNNNTYPNDLPASKIDYIFGYPKNKWKVNSYTILRTGLSDHCALLADIEFIK